MNEIEDSNGDSFFDNDKSGSGDSADSAEDYKPKPKAELKIKSEF